MRIAPTLGLVLVLVSSPALAESVSEAITAFGLVGTWSEDCLFDLRKGCDASADTPCAKRLTFQKSFWSAPMIILKLAKDKERPASITKSELTSAIRVTKDKIRIRYTVESNWMLEFEEVFQIEGDKLRLIDSHTTDGKIVSVVDGYYDFGIPHRPGEYRSKTPFLERCLNEQD